ncbi:MAG: YbfB/YjiJ family MFS transporter [Elstera sp.]
MTAPVPQISAFRQALPGMAALIVGHGIGRFAFTPLIPALVAAGLFTGPQAVWLGAANLIGYFLGSLIALRLADRFGVGFVLRASVGAVLLATLAGIPNWGPDWGLIWLAPWRMLTGISGALILILGPSALLSQVPVSRRGTISGLVFCGIGVGIILAGTVVPWLARIDIVAAWLGLSALALLLWIPAWSGWPEKPPVAALPSGPGPRWTLPLFALAAAYAGDAMGFIPHTVFWVDYIARGLGHGVAVGGYFWVLFGIGAALGVLLLGRLADKIGFGAALTLMLGAKALAIALPLVSSSIPALVISSLIVGAATPGAAMLTSGVALELVGADAHRGAWRKLTLIFSSFQAVAGQAFAALFAATQAYEAIFAIGAGLLALSTLAAGLAWRGQRLHKKN